MFAANLRWSFVAFVLALVVVLVTGLPSSAAVKLPNQVGLEKVDFERHIMGLLSRLGCNAGACHGSFQGKGGLRLSLFGYDPAMDYAALTRDIMGRRINPVDPDRSLFLLKATAQIGHGGGMRFARNSWQYQAFREWIRDGARWEQGSGQVVKMTLSPDEYATIQPGQTGQVRVRAHFADHSEEDVTLLCDFRTQDDGVAEVTAPGMVKGIKPGDTALVVSYRGNVRALRVLVPMPAARGFRYPRVPEANYIDREVFAKLRLLNMVPSDLASDAEFLRRVTIDTIGSLPSPEEVRGFLADRSANKRAKKIEELLAHPLHAALWATKFSDITGNNTNEVWAPNGTAQVKFSQMWHDWFRKRIADNMPYDEIVRGVLCATGRDGRSLEEWMKEVKTVDETALKSFVSSYARKASLDLYWKIGRAPTLEQFGERTAAAFLGIRLECAQCHKHPFDRWTQADYRAYANIFGQVVIGMAQDTYQALTNGKRGKLNLPKGASIKNEVHIGGKGRSLPPPSFVPVIKEVIIAANMKKHVVWMQPPPTLPAKALGGPDIPNAKGEDARVHLFEWMRRPDNPYFARSFVNRIWGHYFGVGLVDPVDHFSLANPPSNARLLDALARDFVNHKYDIRHLERTVLNARAYQLSSTMNDTNKADRNNYSHSFVRPMMAEVVVDILSTALGVPEDFGPDAPPGSRAIEVGSTRVAFNNDLGFAFRTFGRPDRNLACDCERGTEPTLPQTLFLMTDANVLDKLRTHAFAKIKGKPAGKGKGKPAPKGKVKGKQPPAGKGKDKQAPGDKIKAKPSPLDKAKDKQAPAGKEKGKQAGAGKIKGKPLPSGKGKDKPAPVGKNKDKPGPPTKGKGKQPPAGEGKGKATPALVEGRLAKLLKSTKTDAEILEELFLATLSRFPSTEEKKHFADYLAARKAPLSEPVAKPEKQKLRALALQKEREDAFADALWALINTREFILNH